MDLSPAAQAFWGSVIRHVLTAIAGILVAHGYVSNDVAHPYIEEGVGLALQGVVMVWANRIVYWQQIRAIIGRAMPAATHHEVMAKVEELKDAEALPSVFTAPTVVPSLVKPLMLILTLGLGATLLPACTSNKLVVAANAEHVAVVSVHAVIQAEAAAFEAGAYDNTKHQTYVAALLKVTQSEKALNDALMTWNAASGQPMPQVVSIAVQNIQKILTDVTPLIPANSAVASLAASANAAIAALTGGK
jgi:hypothetical protein